MPSTRPPTRRVSTKSWDRSRSGAVAWAQKFAGGRSHHPCRHHRPRPRLRRRPSHRVVGSRCSRCSRRPHPSISQPRVFDDHGADAEVDRVRIQLECKPATAPVRKTCECRLEPTSPTRSGGNRHRQTSRRCWRARSARLRPNIKQCALCGKNNDCGICTGRRTLGVCRRGVLHLLRFGYPW